VDWIFLILSCVCFVEIFIFLGVSDHVKELKKFVFKISATIRSPQISDRWKEKILPRYAWKLFLRSLLLFGMLVGSFSPFFVFSGVSVIFDGHFVKLCASVEGIGASALVASAYALLRRRKPKHNYGAVSRFFHRLVLARPFVGEATFDLERLMHASKVQDASAGKHVFVAGLARAGTTILMRSLYAKGQFRSLTYRDMPFILAPNMWHAITRLSRRKSEIQERSHGDGLMVDYDSPEALEEVFWRVFCGPAYIKQKCLIPMLADPMTVEKFRSFIALVLKEEREKRYLSKNNNNILRLESITKAFPNAVIVVPFREPLQQAYSLLNQHRRFLRIHAADPFAKKYMTWLAHHEFGADHRPFVFFERTADVTDTDSLGYWLQLWLNTYTYLSENLPTQAILVSYESLCDDTKFVWEKLSERIDLSPYDQAVGFSKSLHQVDASLAPDGLRHAYEVYNDLVTRSIGFKT
jgi:hypothetical protein